MAARFSAHSSWTQFRAFLKNNYSVLAWTPVVWFVAEKIICVAPVTGSSMQVRLPLVIEIPDQTLPQPTLNPDSSMLHRDVVLFDRSPTWNPRSIARGDVVLFSTPHSPATLAIKRVVALEGDTVKTLNTYPEKTVTIPRGHMWVEGDEPFHSNDSNIYGPVSMALVTGRAFFVVWPHWRFGPIHSLLLDNKRKRVQLPE